MIVNRRVSNLKIGASLSSKILTLGPDYKNTRGGMGEVISGYSQIIQPFNFICTHKTLNKFFLAFYNFYLLFFLQFYLLIHPHIRVVHIHGASWGSFFRKYIYFLVSKFVNRKKVIYHIHSGEFSAFYHKSNRIIKKLIRHFIQRADVVVCLSSVWSQFFLNEFKCKKLIVLPNMVSQVESVTEKKNISGKVTFLYLGKLRNKKGVFDLIKVAKDLAKLPSNSFELIIGGVGEQEKEYSKFISDHHLENNIKFLGWISGVEKRNVFATAHVFVLPSYFEGFPVSVLEAMSFGMPIIATNVGGIPDVVKDYINGFLITPGDISALNSKMLLFIKNKELINEFGKQSLRIVQSYYNDSIVPQLNEVYEELLIGEVGEA